MDCDRTDCIHFKVCEEWKSLCNDNYINDSYGNCDYYAPTVELSPVINMKPLTAEEKQGLIDALKKSRLEAVKLDDEGIRGEWIVIHNALGETKYQCNQCQHYVKPSDDKNFCPYCGADMRKGEWIPNKGNGYSNPGRHCSLCGENVEFSEPVCPGCRARMKIGGDNT